ncbi:hypothetical protein ACA910_009896 [Epithemia clementina (nom. ined.)]
MSLNVISTSLMPISQIAAWFAVIKTESASNPTSALYNTLGVTATFYCVWALYKVFIEGNKNELGQYSMGLAALGSFCHSKYGSLAGIGVVIVNFLLALFLVLGMSAADLADLVKHTDSTAGIIWAWIFKVYLLSSTAFWVFSFVQVSKLEPDNTRNTYRVV